MKKTDAAEVVRVKTPETIYRKGNIPGYEYSHHYGNAQKELFPTLVEFKPWMETEKKGNKKRTQV
jgi:hypothetical protein